MALNFSRISKELEAFGNEFIDALMTDISHPKFRSTIRDIVRTEYRVRQDLILTLHF